MAMLLEHGLHGSTASGFVADAINFYLDRKYGLPFDAYPTARDKIAHNLPIDWSWVNAPIAALPNAPARPAAPRRPAPRQPFVLGRPVRLRLP